MKVNKRNKNLIPELIVKVCGLITVCIGFIALIGWVFRYPLMTTFSSDYIPMAPSTSFLFLLLGTGIYFHSHFTDNRRIFLWNIGISLFCILTAFTLLTLSLQNIFLELEHPGFSLKHTPGIIPIGHMSSITAICFVISSLSFIIELFSVKHPWFVILTFFISCILIFSACVLFTAYLLEKPIFYGGSIIPPALPTSFSFILLGIALVILSGQKLWSNNLNYDAATTKEAYYLLSAFMFITIGLITTGSLYYKKFSDEYKLKAQNELSSIADMKIEQQIQYRNERLLDAEILYKNYSLSRLINSFLERPGDVQIQNELYLWLDKYKFNDFYEDIQLLDINGNEKMLIPGTRAQISSTIKNRIPEILKSQNIIFEDFYRNEYDHKIYMALIIPVINESNKDPVIAILVLRINPYNFLYPLIIRRPIPSKTAETLIIRRDGNYALFLNELRFYKNSALNLRFPITNIKLPAVNAVLGKEGIFEGVDYRGVPVLSDIHKIPGSPWYIVSRMDTSEIYSPIRERFWLVGIFILVLVLVFGSVTGLTLGQQRTRLYQDKYAAAEALISSEHRYRTLFETMDEGFCVIEMLYDQDGKASDFRFMEINPSFEKNTGLQQALGKSIHQLVPGFESNWIEICDKVVRTGEALRFENPVNSMNRFFDVYAFRLGMDGSRRVGVFFNDITRHKNNEIEIKESKRKLEELYLQLNDVREDERAGISREIHDELGTSLTALKMDLNWTKDDKGWSLLQLQNNRQYIFLRHRLTF